MNSYSGEANSASARHVMRVGRKGGGIKYLLGSLVAFLLVVGGSASAFADESEPGISPDSPTFFPGDLINAQAAEELPHSDLGREEALELMSAVFSPALQNPAGMFDELDVEKFHADNVALIAPGDQPGVETEEAQSDTPTLLTSTIPLATENAAGEKEAVDLSLEYSDGQLQPVNPLVDVGIPSELGDGISLPDTGVGIELVGAPMDRSPSIAEESTAFYPNVALDTDFTVAPTPTGMETFTQLRSPEAPRSQTFDLSLPPGAQLVQAAEGGAKVLLEDKEIVVIPPPVAYDAEGASIPVQLNVSGSSFTVTVSPAEDAAYPLLVDPLYEQPYVWLWNHSFDGMSDWKSSLTSKAAQNPWAFELRQEGYIDGVGMFPGLAINTTLGTVATPGSAMWTYYVPRYALDKQALGVPPASYIKKMSLHRLWFKVDAGVARPITGSPALRFGLWNEPLAKWTSEGSWRGDQGNLTDLDWTYNSLNLNSEVGVKQGKFLLETYEPQLQHRRLLVGEAAIELSDNDAPIFNQLGSPTQWVNDKVVGSIPFTAEDPGLGVREMVVKLPNGVQFGTKSSCTGISSNPCPRSWASSSPALPTVDYKPAQLPQGENWLQIEAVDPLGRRSPEEGHGVAETRIKVDHTSPSLAFSGSLVDHANNGTKASEYKLSYSAADGFEAAASALTPIGPSGTGETKPQRPMGIATDSAGNIWMVERENNRVLKFSSSGQYLSQFGSTGTANGQFTDARGIAIAADNSIWVSDTATGRIQRFSPSGTYLQKFGSKGTTGTGNVFAEAYGLATGPGGKLWVADPGSGRVALFKETANGEMSFVRNVYGTPSNPTGADDLVTPVGVATDASGNAWVTDNGAHRIQSYDPEGKFTARFGSEGTSAGKFKNPVGIAVAPTTGHLLVADGGNNRIQEFLPNGVFLRQMGSTGTDNAQFQEPRGIAYSQANEAVVADAGNRRIARWSAVDVDPQSGVSSTEVKVDGVLAEEKYAPGCATKNCAISREWSLKANGLPSGTHEIEVTATDGVGLPTTKDLTVTTDATVPQISAPSQFFNAPEGWLEQKGYTYIATASDPGGYGVTSMTLKIDGQVKKTMTQPCAAGGCSASLIGSINMASYKGGAHPAELVTTDAAGNTSKKAWTINVDPKGNVPIAEATATLEAVEDTSQLNALGESQEEPKYAGTALGLSLEEAPEEFHADGTLVPLQVADTPAAGMTMDVLADGSFAGPCQEEFSSAAEEAAQTGEPEDEEESESAEPIETCNESEEGSQPVVQPVEVVPDAVNAGATANELVDDDAVVAANTATHVDTVIRPLSNGGMTFENIRDGLGPETFSWEVNLEPDQELKLVDDLHAVVYYEGGHPAFSISAVPAHDAIGTTVPTSLSVSDGRIVTLHVAHRAGPVSGGSFTYPVIAGAGWQGGYQFHSVEMPPEEEEEEIEIGGTWSTVQTPDHVIVRVAGAGPPIANASADDDPSSLPDRYFTMTHKFKFSECRYNSPPPEILTEWLSDVVKKCRQEKWVYRLISMMSVHGWYHDNQVTDWVWISKGNLHCSKWGPDQPAMVNCKKRPKSPDRDSIQVLGDYRFPPASIYNPPLSACVTVRGRLEVDPSPVEEETIYKAAYQWDPCQWP